MDRGRLPSRWPATAAAAALLATTLNFLQPLAHVALMRHGPASMLWSVICGAATADPAGEKSSKPDAVDAHACCLGLTHSVAFAAPPGIFVVVAFPDAAAASLSPAEQSITTGIRDGPGRPRGPPLRT